MLINLKTILRYAKKCDIVYILLHNHIPMSHNETFSSKQKIWSLQNLNKSMCIIHIIRNPKASHNLQKRRFPSVDGTWLENWPQQTCFKPSNFSNVKILFYNKTYGLQDREMAEFAVKQRNANKDVRFVDKRFDGTDSFLLGYPQLRSVLKKRCSLPRLI